MPGQGRQMEIFSYSRRLGVDVMAWGMVSFGPAPDLAVRTLLSPGSADLVRKSAEPFGVFAFRGTFTFIAGKIAKTGDMKIDTPVATMGIRGTTPHVEISDAGTVKFSTLIEEGKSKITKGPPFAQQPEQKVDHKPNLNICRGC
jgi:hypothetical protein